MTKITADHLTRGAFVYVRQSTADQLVHNQESRRRQYGLADRAKQLGWTTVEVVDDDLGRSGGGITRPGFERLLTAICEGRVGAVFAIEASRLARNGRDWHTLIEFCGLVGTVIVDEDGIYDPRHSNDRLLLGMRKAGAWWQFALAEEADAKVVEALNEQYEVQKRTLDARFEDKVEKVRRGDDLPPGVMKMVKVFVRGEAQAAAGRQDGRPPRQQGRHLQGGPGRGHAVPGGRHARRPRA